MNPYWRVSAWLAVFWLLCAALGIAGLWTTLQIGTVRMQGDSSLPGLIRLQGIPWLAAAVLTPAAVAWSFLTAHRRMSWPLLVGAHLAGLVVFALADTLLTQAIHRVFQPRHVQFTLEAITGRVASGAVLIATKYACIVIATWAYLHFDRAVASRAQAEQLARVRAELERDLTDVRLMVLRQQLQPHFLFNALNAVAGLIESDPPRAQRLLLQLSDLLRLALRRSVATHATLGEELDFADRYLAVERERLGDRLEVRFDVDADLLGATLPSFTVQPLVENAVRHGIARCVGGGTIRIAAGRREGAIELAVTNDVASGTSTGPEGHGLSSLRARLAGMYRGAAALRTGMSESRFTAVVTVPGEQV